MKRIAITLAAIALAALGCQQSGPTGPTNSMSSVGNPMFTNTANSGNGVVHRVSVGGHDADFFPADKNFSLIAIEHGDGSVTGEWTDMFGGDLGGVHIEVDCLSVVGNQATIGGVIKNGTSNGVDVTGQRALTRVWDFGKSANDPPDAISFSFFPTDGLSCRQPLIFPQLQMTDGQVTVD